MWKGAHTLPGKDAPCVCCTKPTACSVSKFHTLNHWAQPGICSCWEYDYSAFLWVWSKDNLHKGRGSRQEMLIGFTYIWTGTEYRIKQKGSCTNNHFSCQSMQWVVLIACLIFLLTQKRCSGLLLLMTVLHCYVAEASGQKDGWCSPYYIFTEQRQT